MRKHSAVLVGALLSVALAACGDSDLSTLPPIQVDLSDQFEELPDFTDFTDVKAKKAAFFGYLLPIVRAHNDHVLELRRQVILLSVKPALSDEESAWLATLAAHYRVEASNGFDETFWQTMKRRVDVVPASLALAQAANESAWGTSRFATKGNNLFGQWCFSAGCGLVPKARNAGASHEVAKFPAPSRSVRSYIHNLNVNSAYKDVRIIRAEQRAEDGTFSGLQLAEGLARYSERGQAYIDEVQSMIRSNNLQANDRDLTLE